MEKKDRIEKLNRGLIDRMHFFAFKILSIDSVAMQFCLFNELYLIYYIMLMHLFAKCARYFIHYFKLSNNSKQIVKIYNERERKEDRRRQKKSWRIERAQLVPAFYRIFGRQSIGNKSTTFTIIILWLLKRAHKKVFLFVYDVIIIINYFVLYWSLRLFLVLNNHPWRCYCILAKRFRQTNKM